HQRRRHQHLSELHPRAALLVQGVQELAGGDLLRADEDVAQAVAAAGQGVELLLEPPGSVAPELLLVGVTGRAEAVEGERAELGGVRGVVRAPHRARGVELAQAVPAGDEIRLGGRAPTGDHVRGCYLINPLASRQSLPATGACDSVGPRPLSEARRPPWR